MRGLNNGMNKMDINEKEDHLLGASTGLDKKKVTVIERTAKGQEKRVIC